MRVSIQSIIDLLPIVADRDWEIRGSGAIRQTSPAIGGHCPLSALNEEVTGVPTPGLFFDDLVPPGDLRLSFHDVMNASDFRGERLRPRILRALGLKEVRA